MNKLIILAMAFSLTLSFIPGDVFAAGIAKDHSYNPPLEQVKSGASILDVTCNAELQIAYKKDLSKAICVTPETLFKLERRDWVFDNFTPNDPSIYGNDKALLCNNSDDKVVSFGYSVRESNLTVKVSSFEKIQYDGFPGAIITYDRAFDGGMSRGTNNGYFPYVHCINDNVNSFDDCQNVSHYFSDDDWPFLECITLDGKYFHMDERRAMGENVIEIKSINYPNDTTIEFVGYTPRGDLELAYTVTDPLGNLKLEWADKIHWQGNFTLTITIDDTWINGGHTILIVHPDLPYSAEVRPIFVDNSFKLIEY